MYRGTKIRIIDILFKTKTVEQISEGKVVTLQFFIQEIYLQNKDEMETFLDI